MRINYPFWFKLIPWEYIAVDEPELAEILTKIVTAEKAVVLNPAYTMLFQSKAILKYLWELIVWLMEEPSVLFRPDPAF